MSPFDDERSLPTSISPPLIILSEYVFADLADSSILRPAETFSSPIGSLKNSESANLRKYPDTPNRAFRIYFIQLLIN